MRFEKSIDIDAPVQRVWDAPTYFEYRQKSRGMTSVAGHRVEALEAGRSRLTLTLEMRGFLIPVVALFSKGMVNRYMTSEARGMKEASESSESSESGESAESADT